MDSIVPPEQPITGHWVGNSHLTCDSTGPGFAVDDKMSAL